jgi:hypothetical protein
MDMEETTVPVVRKPVEKSGSTTSLSRFTHTSSKQYKDKDDVKDDSHIQVASTRTRTTSRARTRTRSATKSMTSSTMMGSNEYATGSVDDVERVGMELPVAGQSIEKSGDNSLEKKASKSVSGTSRLADTSTSSMMMGSNGRATGSVNDERAGMDLEASVAGQSMEKSGQSVEKLGNTSLQKEISRAASDTSRLANTSTRSMMMGSNGHATESVDDDARVNIDLEASVAGISMEKSGSNSLQKEAPKSTGRTSTSTSKSTTTTTTGMQKIDEGNEEEEDILGWKTRN